MKKKSSSFKKKKIVFQSDLYIIKTVNKTNKHIDTSTALKFFINDDGLAQYYNNTIEDLIGGPQTQQWQKDRDGEFYLWKNTGERQYYDSNGKLRNAPVLGWKEEWILSNGRQLYTLTHNATQKSFIVSENFLLTEFDIVEGTVGGQVPQPFMKDKNNVVFLYNNMGMRFRREFFRTKPFIVMQNENCRFYNETSGEMKAEHSQPWQRSDQNYKFIYKYDGGRRKLYADSMSGGFFIVLDNGMAAFYNSRKFAFSDVKAQPFQIDDDGNSFLWSADDKHLFLHFDTGTGQPFIVNEQNNAIPYDAAGGVFGQPMVQQWQIQEDGEFFFWNFDDSKTFKQVDQYGREFIVLKDGSLQFFDNAGTMAGQMSQNYQTDGDGNFFMFRADGTKQYYDIKTGKEIDDPHEQFFHLDTESGRYYVVAEVEGQYLAQFYDEVTGMPDGKPKQQPWHQDEITGQFFLFTDTNSREYYDETTGNIVERAQMSTSGYTLEPETGRYYMIDKTTNMKQYYNVATGMPEGEPIAVDTELEIPNIENLEQLEDKGIKDSLGALAEQNGFLLDLKEAMKVELAKNETEAVRKVEIDKIKEKQEAGPKIDWRSAIQTWNHNVSTRHDRTFLIVNKLYRNAGQAVNRIMKAMSKKNGYDQSGI